MRKSLVGVALAFVACAAVACDGGGGGGGGGSLTAGSYVISNTAIDDGCGLLGGATPADFNGQILVVSTDASSVIIDFGNGGVPLPRSGNSFGETDSGTGVQIATDCTVDFASEIAGEITSNNNFDYSESVDLSNATGAGCSTAGVTTPCSSSISYHAALQ